MGARIASLNPDRELQAYVVGLAIGDGNLSNPNGRAIRLRIACDTKYPALADKIAATLKQLLPDNKVSRIPRKARCVDLSVYSNHLENLVGWKAKGGSKHRQQITIPSWICTERLLIVSCLRGLIETDGSIYRDRGYLMVVFSTVIEQLAQQVQAMMIELGFKPRLHRITPTSPPSSVKYQVRLCKDVYAFLDLVRPLKA